jgi:hypothetical protein
MKTKLLPTTITLLSICAVNAHASGIPVIDVSAIAQSATQEVMNYAKYAAEYAKQVEQSSTQLSQYEAQLLSISRYGDPAQLRNLPAIRNIEELSQVYGHTVKILSIYSNLRTRIAPRPRSTKS